LSLTPPPLREPWLLDAVGRLKSSAWSQWFQRLVSLDVIDTIYPIGSIYISVVSTNPADLFKRGTWVAFGAGRTLVSLDSTDTDFDTAEELRGAKTATPSAHAGAAVASHSAHTHTYTQVPNHVHVQNIPSDSDGTYTTGGRDTASGGVAEDEIFSTNNPTGGVATGTTANESATLTHTVTQPSAHAAMSVVQPSIVVYMWKRTA
jgi:hypothetical protein